MSATHTEELKDSCLGQRVRVEPVPHSSSCTCSSEHTSSRVAIRIQRDVTSSLLGLTIGDGDFAEQVWDRDPIQSLGQAKFIVKRDR